MPVNGAKGMGNVMVVETERQAVARWAASMVADPGVRYLDTETTGLGDDAEIVEIAILDGSGAILLDTLIRPNRRIPADATALHSITNAMVRDAPGWPEIYFEAVRLLAGHPCVIYNAEFDRRILDQVNREHGLEPMRAAWQCAMKQYAVYAGVRHPRYGGYRWHKLEQAAANFNIPLKAHRARADAEACRALVRAMAGVSQPTDSLLR